MQADSTKELEKVRDKAKESLGPEEAQVFDAHLLFLSDPEFTGAIETEIKDQKINAEAALDETAQKFITIFEMDEMTQDDIKEYIKSSTLCFKVTLTPSAL